MGVYEMEAHIEKRYEPLKQKLLLRVYQSQPFKQVEIPKPNDNKRKLGIPCARDRAVKQVIESIMNPSLRPQSHGFCLNKGDANRRKEMLVVCR